MPPRIHFTCDPDFYALGLSYQARDQYEGDLHVICPGWVQPGVPCECWCHTEEGERIYGAQRRAVRDQRRRAATSTHGAEARPDRTPTAPDER